MRRVRDTYFDLVREFPLRSIKNDRELRDAQAVIDGLLKQDLDEGAEDYLDALTDLVETYEREHHDIAPVSLPVLLRHLVESNDLTAAELAREAGLPRSTVSELLSGRRRLSRGAAQKLGQRFGLPATAFVEADFLGE